jgi:hypothetical protein
LRLAGLAPRQSKAFTKLHFVERVCVAIGVSRLSTTQRGL